MYLMGTREGPQLDQAPEAGTSGPVRTFFQCPNLNNLQLINVFILEQIERSAFPHLRTKCSVLSLLDLSERCPTTGM